MSGNLVVRFRIQRQSSTVMRKMLFSESDERKTTDPDTASLPLSYMIAIKPYFTVLCKCEIVGVRPVCLYMYVCRL